MVAQWVQHRPWKAIAGLLYPQPEKAEVAPWVCAPLSRAPQTSFPVTLSWDHHTMLTRPGTEHSKAEPASVYKTTCCKAGTCKKEGYSSCMFRAVGKV